MTGGTRSCASVPPDGRTEWRSSRLSLCGRAGARPSRCRLGYTLAELMATIAIVAVLAATVGMFFARLLSLQEREREEAYIREKLVDVCGAVADDLSIASSFSMRTNLVQRDIIVAYRQETGGVSLETGRVSRVAYLTLTLNATNRTMELNAYTPEPEGLKKALASSLNGDAPLIPLAGELVSCTLTPFNAAITEEDGIQTSDAALGYLQVTARYTVRNEDGEDEAKTATAGRVVRLWNWSRE